MSDKSTEISHYKNIYTTKIGTCIRAFNIFLEGPFYSTSLSWSSPPLPAPSPPPCFLSTNPSMKKVFHWANINKIWKLEKIATLKKFGTLELSEYFKYFLVLFHECLYSTPLKVFLPAHLIYPRCQSHRLNCNGQCEIRLTILYSRIWVSVACWVYQI